MKAKEVRQLLRISQTTLWRYAKEGTITITKVGTHYIYNAESVYRFINKENQSKTYLYARVSTSKQKKALNNQIEFLKSWTLDNGCPIHGIYKNIASGINFDHRTEFFELLEEVLNYRVKQIIIVYKDYLTRIAMSLFQKFFKLFETEFLVISEVGNPKLDSQDFLEEIVSLMHCYSMKLYSRRKNKQTIEIRIPV